MILKMSNLLTISVLRTHVRFCLCQEYYTWNNVCQGKIIWRSFYFTNMTRKRKSRLTVGKKHAIYKYRKIDQDVDAANQPTMNWNEQLIIPPARQDNRVTKDVGKAKRSIAEETTDHQEHSDTTEGSNDDNVTCEMLFPSASRI